MSGRSNQSEHDIKHATETTSLLHADNNNANNSDIELQASELEDEIILESDSTLKRPASLIICIGMVFVLLVLGFISLWNSHVKRLELYNTPIQSHTDWRQYESIYLDNELHVLLVSDPNTEIASASMSIRVGYYNDPIDIPGLAHFTEHMLFMGSSKYPDEKAYFQYILTHGGFANAFTKEEETNFFFKIQSAHLEGALDHFAQFFIEPLFSTSAINREMHAIDSEHQKNLLNDVRRRYEVLAECSHPSSPLHHYATGSYDTLNRTDIQKRLLDFHYTFYSANRMKLVVLGKQSLADLKLLVSNYFSYIRNLDIPNPIYGSLPFPVNDMKYVQHVALIQPIQQINIITLYWQVKPLLYEYRHNAAGYLAFLFNHESEGTLNYVLKERGWITELKGGSFIDATTFSIFHIELTITDVGMDHVDDIISLVFEYIELIRAKGIKQSYFNTILELDTIAFDFQPNQDAARWAAQLSSRMHSMNIQDVLLSPTNRVYNPVAIQSVLKQLTTETLTMQFSSWNFTVDMFDHKDKYYGTLYSWRLIPGWAMQEWLIYKHLISLLDYLFSAIIY